MPKPCFLKPFFFLYRIFFRKIRGLSRSRSHVCQSKNHVYGFDDLAHRSPNLSEKTLVIFNLEQSLLKSPFLFPYFMLVAFEAGSLLRALLLLLLYPVIFLVGEETGLKIMVMVSFFGIKKETFRAGRAVLPKFFLEDVGLESFEALRKAGNKRVAVSNLPRVMIENFLKDYMEIDVVIGRELKVCGGYFLGLMEEQKTNNLGTLEKDGGNNNMDSMDVIGFTSFTNFLADPLFSYCKDVYLVRRADKRCWKTLPREKYPKKFVFHDGRLGLKPTPSETLSIFIWFPAGFVLSVLRILIAISLPYGLSSPILASTGLQLTVTRPKSQRLFGKDHSPEENHKSVLYVCNHRTLLDPLYLCFALKENLRTVTYSLSKVSEMLAPIQTVRLTRNREQDAKMMEKLMSQGSVVVCPEGTTCREPYLLRFSPLFAEISDDIVPVAVNTHVSMFHGTTAGGLKSLDPVFFLLNPSPAYFIQFLQNVSSDVATSSDGSASRFDVANYIQKQLAEALGFECTKLTRRDKYLVLAGNEGIANFNRKKEDN